MKLIRLSLPVVAVLSLACAAPASQKPAAPPPSPTALPMSRLNPNIVEEDEVHYVERLPKDQYIRLDNRHIRHPNIPKAVEF